MHKCNPRVTPPGMMSSHHPEVTPGHPQCHRSPPPCSLAHHTQPLCLCPPSRNPGHLSWCPTPRPVHTQPLHLPSPCPNPGPGQVTKTTALSVSTRQERKPLPFALQLLKLKQESCFEAPEEHELGLSLISWVIGEPRLQTATERERRGLDGGLRAQGTGPEFHVQGHKREVKK